MLSVCKQANAAVGTALPSDDDDLDEDEEEHVAESAGSTAKEEEASAQSNEEESEEEWQNVPSQDSGTQLDSAQDAQTSAQTEAALAQALPSDDDLSEEEGQVSSLCTCQHPRWTH